MKVVRLSDLRTGRLYPPGSIPGTHFCYRLSRPQGHSAAGRIVSMKNSNDTIGNRTSDLHTLFSNLGIIPDSVCLSSSPPPSHRFSPQPLISSPNYVPFTYPSSDVLYLSLLTCRYSTVCNLLCHQVLLINGC